MNANRGIFWGTAIGTLLLALGMGIGGVVYAVHVGDEAATSTRFDARIDQRLQATESLVTDLRIDAKGTRTDVAWIRQFLEHPPVDAHKGMPAAPGLDKVAAP